MTESTPLATPAATRAWVTLLTRSSYLAGALVLDQSLRENGSIYPLVVFATKELPIEARDVLESREIRVRDIEYLEPASENLVELDGHDARFADTWTKLRCFEMVEYERVVMLDSDMLVTANMDELMTMDLPEGWIAAAHACTCNPLQLKHYPKDWIPANCAHTLAQQTIPLPTSQFELPTHHKLNSGLVVLTPSLETFSKITTTLNKDPVVKTFGFPDQDLLAYEFHQKFMPLSYRYNALKTLRNCHQGMWKDEDVKNVHYIMKKPWNERLGEKEENAITHAWWWESFGKLEKNWGKSPNWAYVRGTVVE